ncbi:MAG TPA: hypothetical protein PLX69_24425 [Leptospiraceae bacterium]|nr:hypothetical protein [Leptospiraceae bacterium]
MKHLLILILLLMFDCNQETNSHKNQKRNDSILRFFVLKLLFTPPYTNDGIPETCDYQGQPIDWGKKLKSIDIYFNGSLFLNNSINSESIRWELNCFPFNYKINLNENSKLKSITVYMKYNDTQKKYEYTSVKLQFKDNTFADYPMNFNGDPDTFNEFTAGEYRFVAVR